MLNELEQQKIERIESMKSVKSKTALTEIISFLQDKSLAVRLASVEALSTFRGFPRAKRVLFGLLEDRNCEIRLHAVESLESFHGNDVPSMLVTMLKDRNWVVRVSTIEALQSVGGKREIPNLLAMLSDKNEIVRGYAAIALGELGGKCVLPAIREQLKKETKIHAAVRMHYALGSLGEKGHLEDILQILMSTNSYRVRIVAINCLVDLANDDTVSIIIESFGKLIRREQPRSVMSTVAKAYKDLKELAEK